MNNVTVDKKDLIEKIKANRDEHRAIFLKAQEKYREAVIVELDKRLREVRSGRAFSLGFHMPEPVDYTHEYDMALEQLDWDIRGTVELDQDSFRQLVLNQWHWARHFAANTEFYVEQ